MEKKEPRFILHETDPSTSLKTVFGKYDTYQEACDIVERLPKERIPFCSIEVMDFKI
jgi:hypothetical protein